VKRRFEIIDSITTVNKNLKTIFLSGMGEPFFSPVYLSWLKNFKKENYPVLEEIKFNTNGQKITPQLWSKFPAELKKLKIFFIVSIDGATKPTYEKNRAGGSFKTLLR